IPKGFSLMLASGMHTHRYHCRLYRQLKRCGISYLPPGFMGGEKKDRQNDCSYYYEFFISHV
ncbi:MAG: hypothetical protein II102_01100, partial [Bacteroidales bacterium]|nr:hypothetical protein [Bacteroidales bacterium]